MLAGLLFCLPALGHNGKEVEAKLPSGKIASAHYHVGKLGPPAVLILHGFLQTRSFPTVASATDALATANYTVLAPTLSLGISRRNQSLPCEAVHTHSLDEDLAELSFWVRWLIDHGHRRIVLVGHSFGSVQILKYLTGKPPPEVSKAVLISLVEVRVKQDPDQRARLARELRERAARGDKSLVDAEFAYCKRYVAPPSAFLSYLTVSRDTILDGLARARVPVDVLLGGADDRMGSDWIDRLKTQHVTVRVIEGANHFFDNQYEFDLQDALQQSLKSVSAQRTER
jgi:dienelactone hydrolase